MKRRTFLNLLAGASAVLCLPAPKPTLEAGPDMGDYTLTPGYMEPGKAPLNVEYGGMYRVIEIWENGRLTSKYMVDIDACPGIPSKIERNVPCLTLPQHPAT